MGSADKIVIDVDAEPALKAIRKINREASPYRYRKWLYIFLLPLLVIEWVLTLSVNTIEVSANAFRDAALSLKQYINAEAKPADTKQPK